jgi:serine/threonine-protein kinase
VVPTDESRGNQGFYHVLPGGDVGIYTNWVTPRVIKARRMSTGETKVVTEGVRSYWADTGHLIFATVDGRILAGAFDIETMELTEQPFPLIDGVGITVGGDDAMYSVAASGTLIYWSAPTSQADLYQLVWIDRDGGVETIDPSWTFSIPVPVGFSWRLSPDDSRVALAEVSESNTDIWVKSLPDGPRSRLTRDDAIDWRPEWSPDGTRITFSSARTGAGAIWSRAADGTGVPELLFDGFEVNGQGFWDPTGEWLVLRTAGGTNQNSMRDIFAIRPGLDSVATPLLATPDMQEEEPAISPDGKWIAYAANETGNVEIFVRPFPNVDDGKVQVSTQGGIAPMWAHSGRELFFLDDENVMVSASVEIEPTFRVLSLDPLFPMPPLARINTSSGPYDVSSDDQRFLIGRRAIADAQTASEPQLILVQNWYEELRARMGGN